MLLQLVPDTTWLQLSWLLLLLLDQNRMHLDVLAWNRFFQWWGMTWDMRIQRCIFLGHSIGCIAPLVMKYLFSIRCIALMSASNSLFLHLIFSLQYYESERFNASSTPILLGLGAHILESKGRGGKEGNKTWETRRRRM